MKKKWTIVAFSICITIVVGLIATIIVLASGTQGVGTSVSVLYVATDIEGTVSAKYSKVNKNTGAVISTTDMVTSSGSKTVSFLSTTPTTTNLLNPTESNIALTAEQDLVITYTFTAVATYYATLEYKDNSTNASNIEFSYALNDGAYSNEMSMPIEVTPDKSTTYSIKLHIANTARNANLSGSLNWALTKDGSQTPSGGDNIDTVSLSYANNEGSVVNSNTVTFKKNADGTKFKIVGPTPIIDSTSTTSYLNGNFDERTTTATGKVSSIDDLINNNGDEFFFFSPNSSVVGSTGFMPTEPSDIYYTSTADDTLESWYDIPTSDLTLYSCFITTNYKTEEKYVATEKYEYIYVSNRVTQIVYEAFPTSVVSCLIPQSVKKICNCAFSNCDSYGPALIIPNSVTRIEMDAFSGMSLQYNPLFIYLGSGIKEIPDSLFRGLQTLYKITIPDTVTSIGNGAFAGAGISKLVLPNSLTYVGDYAFNRLSLETNTLNGVNYLGSSTNPYMLVYGVESKTETSYVLSEQTRFIYDEAFSGCSSLKSLTLPDSVVEIGRAAFKDCTALTNLVIPNGIASVGTGAFSGSGLDYSVLNGVYYLGNDNNPYLVACGVEDSALTTYNLSEQTRVICGSTFSSCNSLTNISLPDELVYIGEECFKGCSSLSSIEIPNKVERIEYGAFYECTNLTSITIGRNVKYIGEDTFYSCTSLGEAIFVDTSKGWYLMTKVIQCKEISVDDSLLNATYLKSTYNGYVWTKNS